MAEWKPVMLLEEKYTDAEAVAAVATADDYVKTTGDEMTGNLTIEKDAAGLILTQPASAGAGSSGKFEFNRYRTDGVLSGDYIGFHRFYGSRTNNTLGYGAYFICIADGNATAANVPAKLLYGVRQGDASLWSISFNASKKFDIGNGTIKDPKNHAASALSGTKKLVEIDIGGTSYYFEVYPTKA